MSLALNRRAFRRMGQIFAELANQALASSTIKVTVGIHKEEGAAIQESGATLADIAAFQEFGTSTIPRRSWLLDGIAENEEAIHEAMRRVARAVGRRKAPPQVLYLQLGEFIVKKLQARIRTNIPPPLASSTVAQKGSTLALVDSGLLLASITAQLDEGLG